MALCPGLNCWERRCANPLIQRNCTGHFHTAQGHSNRRLHLGRRPQRSMGLARRNSAYRSLFRSQTARRTHPNPCLHCKNMCLVAADVAKVSGNAAVLGASVSASPTLAWAEAWAHLASTGSTMGSKRRIRFQPRNILALSSPVHHTGPTVRSKGQTLGSAAERVSTLAHSALA